MSSQDYSSGMYLSLTPVSEACSLDASDSHREASARNLPDYCCPVPGVLNFCLWWEQKRGPHHKLLKADSKRACRRKVLTFIFPVLKATLPLISTLPAQKHLIFISTGSSSARSPIVAIPFSFTPYRYTFGKFSTQSTVAHKDRLWLYRGKGLGVVTVFQQKGSVIPIIQDWSLACTICSRYPVIDSTQMGERPHSPGSQGHSSPTLPRFYWENRAISPRFGSFSSWAAAWSEAAAMALFSCHLGCLEVSSAAHTLSLKIFTFLSSFSSPVLTSYISLLPSNFFLCPLSESPSFLSISCPPPLALFLLSLFLAVSFQLQIICSIFPLRSLGFSSTMSHFVFLPQINLYAPPFGISLFPTFCPPLGSVSCAAMTSLGAKLGNTGRLQYFNNWAQL